MEEQGGDGTAFSHWDARIMHTEVHPMWIDVGWGCEHRDLGAHGWAVGPWPGEVMSPESSSIPRISDLTLALLEAWLSLAWTHWMQTRWQSSSM